MAFTAKGLTAAILALVFLSLTMAPTWTMAFLILFGMIFLAVDAARRKERRQPEPSSSSSGIEPEVYLSFRDLNTCNRFREHLCRRLKTVGIYAVSIIGEDEDLRFREEIELKLKEAIKRSRISIAILSPNYASSRWCLMELAQMWECRKLNGQTIIPIFYDVSPSDVIDLAGDFGRYFSLQQIGEVDSNTIGTWREALREIGGLRGYIREDLAGHDGQLVKEVVKRVAQELKKDPLFVTDKLVGIELHVEEMMRKLGVAYSEGQATEVQKEEVCAIGILGVPGVGKTTLAKLVCNKMHHLFDACSFLQGISSEGLQALQQRLLTDLQQEETAPLESSSEGIEKITSLFRNVKVLILLDDVLADEQIKALAGNLTWFGLGSRIIVTSNNENVLNAFDIGAVDWGRVKRHEVKPMGCDHALQLFCKHAFQGFPAQDVSEYICFSIDIAKAIGGLPAAIVRHASSLRDHMDIDIWKTTLEELRKQPEDRV